MAIPGGEKIDCEAMTRPALSLSLTAEEFAAWYWLKSELVVFCSAQALGTSGKKRELEARIVDCLQGRTPKKSDVSRRKGKMPQTFDPEMVIGEGWSCNPRLGAYFRETLGTGFRFHAPIRDYIHHGVGRTLREAAECHQRSLKVLSETEIPPQLEYNRHFREYFSAHPKATRDEAIAAWWEKRGKRKS